MLLEPDAHPAAKPFKAALASDGIPFASFAVDDVHKEFERLRALGVEFTRIRPRWVRCLADDFFTRAGTCC